MFMIAGAVLALYIVASYYLMYRSLKKSPGPSGLGWLAFPAAPLAGPMLIWQFVKGFFRRMFS